MAVPPGSETDGSCWKRFREMLTPSDRHKVYEGIFLALTSIIILCICSLPTIIYFTLQRNIEGNDTSSSVSVNCNRDSADVNTVANCSLYSWAMESPNESFGNCSGELYSGGVCRQQLLEWQECAVGGGEEVLLDLTLMESSQEERERDASQFLHFINSFGSDYCQSVAGLLVCQSTFPLCDCATGHSYLASREECEKISMVECEEEWTIAKQYGIPLPTCTDLPEEVKNSTTEVGYDGLPALNITNLTCRYDFFEMNFTCLPLCDQWDERPQALLATFDDALRLTCGILDLILTGFFLLAFIIRRKDLFVFPTLLLLYNAIGRFFGTSLEVIGALGNTRLYCSSMDAIETLASPTFYCIFQGTAGAAFLAFVILTWLFHISFLFFKIAFPILSLRSERYLKWIHLCVLTVAVAIPVAVLIANVSSDESQFSVKSFPPFICSDREGSFYTSILPSSVVAFIVFCMLAVMGWIIHKQKAYTAEVKIIIVLTYFLFFVLFVLCQDAVNLAWSEPLRNATNSYLLCEAVGHVPGRCNQQSLAQYSLSLSLLNCIEYVITVFIPIVNLMFVINCRKLGECIWRQKVVQLLKNSTTKSSQ